MNLLHLKASAIMTLLDLSLFAASLSTPCFLLLAFCPLLVFLLLGANLAVVRVKGPRKRMARSGQGEESDIDVMLIERLTELEDFLTRQGLEV